MPPNKVSVTADDFKKPDKEIKTITLNLPDHESVSAVELIVPDDLNTRKYQLGEEVSFKIFGIKANLKGE